MAFEPVLSVGGKGGNKGGDYAQRIFLGGERLKKIKGWAGNKKVRGLQLWMTNDTDDTAVMLGEKVGKPSEDFNIYPEESITSLSLWGSASGFGQDPKNIDRLGRIRIILSSSRRFDIGSGTTHLGPEKKAVVGSGICVGWRARSGKDIHQFGFQFLKPIKSSQIIQVHYASLPVLEDSTVLKYLAHQDFKNHTEGDAPWTFQSGVKLPMRREWAFNRYLVVGDEVSVIAGIPEVKDDEHQDEDEDQDEDQDEEQYQAPEVEEEPDEDQDPDPDRLNWVVSTPRTYKPSSEEQADLKWNSTGTLEAKEELRYEAVTVKGTLDVDFTATMEITFESESTLTYALTGRYRGVSYGPVGTFAAQIRPYSDDHDSDHEDPADQKVS